MKTSICICNLYGNHYLVITNTRLWALWEKQTGNGMKTQNESISNVIIIRRQRLILYQQRLGTQLKVVPTDNQINKH